MRLLQSTFVIQFAVIHPNSCCSCDIQRRCCRPADFICHTASMLSCSTFIIAVIIGIVSSIAAAIGPWSFVHVSFFCCFVDRWFFALHLSVSHLMTQSQNTSRRKCIAHLNKSIWQNLDTCLLACGNSHTFWELFFLNFSSHCQFSFFILVNFVVCNILWQLSHLSAHSPVSNCSKSTLNFSIPNMHFYSRCVRLLFTALTSQGRTPSAAWAGLVAEDVSGFNEQR
jgi:hypothetical protein